MAFYSVAWVTGKGDSLAVLGGAARETTPALFVLQGLPVQGQGLSEGRVGGGVGAVPGGIQIPGMEGGVLMSLPSSHTPILSQWCIEKVWDGLLEDLPGKMGRGQEQSMYWGGGGSEGEQIPFIELKNDPPAG